MRRKLIGYLATMYMWMDVRSIFVVVGAQPDDEPGPWRWRLEGTDAGAFVWDGEKRDFDFRRGVGAIDEDVNKRIGEFARANLSDLLHRNRTVEIMPVTIVRTE